MWRNIFSLFLVFVNVREGISICKWPCAWQDKIFLDTWVSLDNHEMNQIWRFKGSKATIDGSTRVCWEINGPFITLLDEDNRRYCWRVDVISANSFISIGNLGAVNDTNFCANCDIPPDNPIHTFTAFGVTTPVDADIGCFIPEQCYSSDPNNVKCTWKEKPLKECKKC